MRVPKKINPDRIQDAIVQVFFSTTVPFEPLVGYVYQSLAPLGFSYLNRPPQQGNRTFSSADSMAFQIGPQHYFFNEDVRVRLDESAALTFNCLGSYIGWERYASIIKEVLTSLHSAGVISSFVRVGIRYISVFENMDVQDELTLSFSMGEIQQHSYLLANFRAVWEDEGYLISATLGTERASETITMEDGTILEKKSVIDIDVIRQGFNESNLDRMLQMIDGTHAKEKKIFFGLMKPDFLKSLNPEYE